MKERVDILKEWLNSKSGPFLIEIWPTNRCNLKCLMCGTWANRRRLEEKGIIYNPTEEIKIEVSEERLLKLVEEANKLGAKEFLITGGGEPFMRKVTTLKLMERVKDERLPGNLNTNGTLLREDDIKKIVEMSWDMIMFSIDASSREMHNLIRGTDECFERAKESLLTFKMVKKNLKSDKPKIAFNTVLSNKIYDKIDGLIKFASQVNCESITFIPIIPFDESTKKLGLNDNEKSKLNENIEGLINFSKKLGVETNLNELSFSVSSGEMNKAIIDGMKNSPKDLAHTPCFEPFLHLLVKANGETTFCCMIEESPENIKEKSLEQIWFGEYFDNQRNNFMNRIIRNECRFCVFSQFIRNNKIRENLILS